MCNTLVDRRTCFGALQQISDGAGGHIFFTSSHFFVIRSSKSSLTPTAAHSPTAHFSSTLCCVDTMAVRIGFSLAVLALLCASSAYAAVTPLLHHLRFGASHVSGVSTAGQSPTIPNLPEQFTTNLTQVIEPSGKVCTHTASAACSWCMQRPLTSVGGVGGCACGRLR